MRVGLSSAIPLIGIRFKKGVSYILNTHDFTISLIALDHITVTVYMDSKSPLNRKR